ncbi:unnamed protein product, partial [Rotaria sp. Silwood1]
EDIKNENNKRNELLRKAEEVANSAIEEKRIHDELERQMNLFHKEKRDLFNEVNKSEKRITNTNWIKKKNFKIKLMKFVKKSDNTDYDKKMNILILKQLFNDKQQNLFDEQALLKQHEDSLRKRRGHIQQLKAVKQDRVTIYGRYTLAILKEIEKQAYRFKQIPIEPVGKHTCLIDIKWAIAVEQGLGNLLTGYLSSSREDERGHIEQRILIDNYETARRIMKRSALPNCFAAYLTNGTEMQNISVFRCYTCRSQNPRYFVEDLAEHIHQARKEWNNTERQVQEQKGSDKTINEIKIKCGRLGKKLRELQLIEAPNNSNMDNCEAELSDYDTRIEVIQQRIKDKKSKTENKPSEYR